MTYNVSPKHTNTFDLKRPTLCNLLSLIYQITSSRLKSGQAWSLKMALLCRTTAVPWINITLRRGTKINKCRNHCVETSPTVYWGKVHLFTPYLFRSCINHKLQKVVLLSHKFTNVRVWVKCSKIWKPCFKEAFIERRPCKNIQQSCIHTSIMWKQWCDSGAPMNPMRAKKYCSDPCAVCTEMYSLY